MRPLRAFAVLAVLLVAWGWWRLPAVRADIARHRAAPQLARTAQAITDARPAAPAPMLALADIAPDDLVTAAPITARALPARQAMDGRSRPLRLPAAESSFLAPAVSAQAAFNAPAASRPASAPSPKPAPNPADALASEAYRALAAKDRGAAARGLRLAVAAAPDDPRAAVWRRQIAAIEKRWWGSAYVLARESGGGGLAAAPVLGGGQSGAQLGFTLDPLSRRPTSVGARLSTPNKDIRRDRHAVQAAFGLSWRPVQAASVTVERLVALGREARDAWTLRVAGGAATTRPEGARSWNDLSAYVETGIVGVKRQDLYAAAQARAGRAVALSEKVEAAAGIGAWASVQRDLRTVGRVEVGPTVRVRADTRPAPVELSIDYRVRVAGNADPDTGPAATLSTNF